MIKIKNGYLLVWKPKHKYSKTKAGYIFQHRAVVEDYIKRALKRYEVVHHLDGNRKHNIIENLMIFKSQKEHIQFHLKVQQFGLTHHNQERVDKEVDRLVSNCRKIIKKKASRLKCFAVKEGMEINL